jgi:transglutaminase-like putative cysteine protease
MNFSVVNISDQVIRYSIPTKNVQSDDNYIASMSNLISYRYSTNYSRAKALYDFVEEEVLVLEINPIKYTALDVYEAFEGTKKEIAYYLTALLRAQKIPARIVEGDSDFSTHLWVEAFLNGSWLILDPVGDSQYIEIIVDESYEPLEASFNGKRSIYNNRYPTQTVLDY